MITGITWDDSRLMANLEKAKRNARKANFEFVRSMADGVITGLYLHAPRDTNRYVRAWLQAANQARVGEWLVPDLQPSERTRRYEQILLGQKRIIHKMIRGLETRVERWFVNRGRPIKGWAAAALRHVEKLRHKLAHIEELLAAIRAGKSVILLDAGAANIFGFDEDTFSSVDVRIGTRRSRAKNPKKRRMPVFARGYDREFGGEGRVYVQETVVVVTLKNLEPHARIVEAKTRLLASEMLRLKSLGVTTHRAQFMKSLLEGTGWRRVAT